MSGMKKFISSNKISGMLVMAKVLLRDVSKLDVGETRSFLSHQLIKELRES